LEELAKELASPDNGVIIAEERTAPVGLAYYHGKPMISGYTWVS
jgi:hypothetical protein